MNNLACRPGAVSWVVLRRGSQTGQLLTSKKVSSSSRCSGRSFLCVAYSKAVAVTLLMEGKDVWGCIGGRVDVSSLPSLPLSSSWCGCFPSTGSGGGLHLNMASCKACSTGERRIMAPSLWSGQRGWGADLGGRSWRWMAAPEKGEAIARMIPLGEKQQHLCVCLVYDSNLVIMTLWTFRNDLKTCIIKASDYVFPRLVPPGDLGEDPTLRTKWQWKTTKPPGPWNRRFQVGSVTNFMKNTRSHKRHKCEIGSVYWRTIGQLICEKPSVNIDLTHVEMSNNIEEINWLSFLVKQATVPKIFDAEAYMVQESVTTSVRVRGDLRKVYYTFQCMHCGVDIVWSVDKTKQS